MTTAKVLVNAPHHNAECPLWHPEQNSLFWTDIPQGIVKKRHLTSGEVEEVYRGTTVGGLTLQQDGSLLFLMKNGQVGIWSNGDFKTIIEEIPEAIGTRFNDGIADPMGRVYAGTMASQHQAGKLFRIDPDGSYRVVDQEFGISNGLGFSADGRFLYFTDSESRQIFRYAYDQLTGDLSQRITLIETDVSYGWPDGLTIDNQDCLWSACWDGRQLVRYRPDGSEHQKIAFPVPKVTCLTFGGDDYSDIFVTTAGGDNREVEGSLAGSIFQLRIPGIQGKPEFRSKILLPSRQG